MTKYKEIDYRREILDMLANYVAGLSITNIAQKIDGNRNTVSKYLSILEAEGLVYKNKIGPASLYFSKIRKYISRSIVSSFLKGLLHSIKDELPQNNESYKRIGRNSIDIFSFPLGNEYFKNLAKLRGYKKPIELIKILPEFYNDFDFFQDDVDISIEKLYDDKVIFRFKNSEFLEGEESFINYFSIAGGLIEAIYKQNFDMDIKCDVIDFLQSENPKDSYLDLSIEILNNKKLD